MNIIKVLLILCVIVGSVFLLVRYVGTGKTEIVREEGVPVFSEDRYGLDVSSFRYAISDWLDPGSRAREDKERERREQERIEFEADRAKNIIASTDGRLFVDEFADDFILAEAREKSESSHDQWWLSSGGMLSTAQGIGQSIHGELEESSEIYQEYLTGSSSETSDRGTHPQNIFRLVQRDLWQDYTQEMYFRIDRYITSDDDNRQASNGIFLFNRYVDSDNLYYSGLRTDGAVVIKKKFDGIYTTLYTGTFIDGEYDRDSAPNLLPEAQWIGVRTVVENVSDDRVSINVYSDLGRTGEWELIGSAVDEGITEGEKAFTEKGHVGVRTDFMDVSFDDYRIETKN